MNGYKFMARLKGGDGNFRLFDILGYENGKYAVFIDFIFHMELSRIVCVPTAKVIDNGTKQSRSTGANQ